MKHVDDYCVSIELVSAVVFNKILSTGIFPEILKFSEVKPFFKKGSTTEFSNYRPVSLLTSFSKVREKIIYKRLYCYVTEHNLLVKEQFGFREKSSTDITTYALLNTVLLSLDKKKILLVAYFVIYKKPLTVLIMLYFWLNWNFMVFQELLINY